MRRRVLAVALAGAALAVAPAAIAAPDLGALVLGTGQVGRGYSLQRPAGGVGLGLPTLDLCQIAYPSEKKRRSRVQVVYVPPAGGPGPAVSNEIVHYEPGGAAQALKEVAAAPSRCPKKPIVGNGATATYKVTKAASPDMPPGSVALAVRVTVRGQGRTETLEATVVYLRNGDTLSGVYVYGSTPGARLALARKVARTSAGRLAQSVGGQAA